MKGRVLFLLVGFVLWLWPPLIFANQTDTCLEKPVTLHYKRTPLRQVLTDLSKKTHVSFVYQDSLVDRVHVSCRLNDKSLESILPGIIDKEKIDYRIVDDRLVVLVPARKREIQKPVERKLFKPKDYGIQNPNFKAPKVISDKKPEYPKAAVDRMISGQVSLNLLVNKNGRVDTVYVRKSSGSSLLDSVAIQHAMQAQCSPARLGNKPISMWMKWDFRFQFENDLSARDRRSP